MRRFSSYGIEGHKPYFGVNYWQVLMSIYIMKRYANMDGLAAGERGIQRACAIRLQEKRGQDLFRASCLRINLDPDAT